MKILFSENEDFYRKLGLEDIDGVEYEFNGLKFYKKHPCFFQKYDLFVCAFHILPHNAIITQKCQESKVETVLCSDGIFEFSNAILNPMHKKYNVTLCHPILQDRYLCIGQKEGKYFESFKPTIPYLPKRILNYTDVIPLPDKQRVLVTTANTAYFSEDEFGKLTNLLKGVCQILDNNNIDYDFRIYDNNLISFINAHFMGKKNNIDGGFEDVLEGYSCVITTTSSIIIPSMFHQRSVCQLIYRDYPLFIQSGWNVSSIDMFEQTLPSLLKMDKTRIDIQNRLVLGYIDNPSLTQTLKNLLVDKRNIISEKHFVNRAYYNMINSIFNVNFEFTVRKLYNIIKKNNIIKRLRLIVK